MALNFLEKIKYNKAKKIAPINMADVYDKESIKNWGRTVKDTSKSIKYLDKIKKLRLINE